MDRTVTIFEGPDGAGKSTAIAQLRPSDAVVSHHGPYPDEVEITSRYLEALRPAWERRASVVLDRSWLSEPIYGAVYRGGANRVSVAQRRVLERCALARQGAVVLCRPSRETVLANWEKKNARGEEYLTERELVARVYEAYKALAYQAAYGRGPALPVVTYDYERETVADLKAKLDHERRTAYRPGLRALLVGDRPNSATETVPFAGLDGAGCSAWLADQLEAAGIGEERLAWANAYLSDGRPTRASFIEALQPRAIFALGAEAGRWCRENRLAYRAVPHPQFWKRFRFNEPYPLLEELKRL